METGRRMSADGRYLEIREEADYRFVVATDGPGEFVLGLLPAGSDDLSALKGLTLAFHLRRGTTQDEAKALCESLNLSVRITEAVTSIPPNGGGDGSPLRLVVDRDAA